MRAAIIGGICLAAVSWGGQASAFVIDMEGIAPAGGLTTENSATRAFGDFSLTVNHGHYVDSAEPGILSGGRPDNGSDWLLHDDSTVLTVARTNGAAFSIQAFDATEYAANLVGLASLNHDINVVGSLFGGGSINATFTTDAVHAFETFAFDSTWANLVSVTFQNASRIMAYDNIVVNAPVPAPAAASLFGLGLAALWAARRRRA